MGNVCSRRNGGPKDEENAMALSFANAASAGARQAVMDAVQLAQHGGGSNQIAPVEAFISGIQLAAAEGAKVAIQNSAKELSFAGPLEEIVFAATSGAREGLEAAEILLAHNDIEGAREDMSLEVAAAAAGAGAWVSCLVAAQTHLAPAPNATKYTALLGSTFVAGYQIYSFARLHAWGFNAHFCCPVYGLLHASSDLVKLCAFGGITLGVFVVSSALIAGLLGTYDRAARYTKVATVIAIILVLIFFTVVLCMIFDSYKYTVACACILPGLTVIFVLAVLWHQYPHQYHQGSCVFALHISSLMLHMPDPMPLK